MVEEERSSASGNLRRTYLVVDSTQIVVVACTGLVVGEGGGTASP